MSTKKSLAKADADTLLATLKTRFEKNKNRHQAIDWASVQARLETDPQKLWSLYQMENTGGEPDIIGHDPKSGKYIFCDCSPESPSGRRSICYDQAALDARKANKPKDSAMAVAAEMGIEITSGEQYHTLQQLGKFDLKTSSWILTPPAIRKLGGALFCDRRYDTVFTYHNGADSYYAARGFRGILFV